MNYLFECYGGPSNFIIVGTEQVSETILILVNQCIKQLNIKYSDIESVTLGTTGAGRRSDAELLENDFLAFCKAKNITINNFNVVSDAIIALEGAFSGKTGSILIAGTGSIMFGKDEEGTIHRVGGFGRFIGDEGSGYSLGRKGLNAVAKFLDGRGKPTKLYNRLTEYYGVVTIDDLINLVYKKNFDIASFGKEVLESADNDSDLVAREILIAEIDEVTLHIKTMYEKLKIHDMRLSYIGSLIDRDSIYSRALNDRLYQNFPKIKVQKPELSPAKGAILIGLKSIKSKSK